MLMSLIFAGVFAQANTSTTQITCVQAANLVKTHGAIVLWTGDSTYNRFVSNRSYCQLGERIRAEHVPTRDNASCFIGYVCRPGSQHL